MLFLRLQLSRFAASVIMTTTYNHPVTSMDDPTTKRIYEGASRFANTLAPGAYLVEAIPWLNNLPLWLPGMHWKRQAQDWAKEDMELYRHMVNLANQKQVGPLLCLRSTSLYLTVIKPDPSQGESFVHHMLSNQEKYNLSDDEAAYLAGVLFAAATETVKV